MKMSYWLIIVLVLYASGATIYMAIKIPQLHEIIKKNYETAKRLDEQLNGLYVNILKRHVKE